MWYLNDNECISWVNTFRAKVSYAMKVICWTYCLGTLSWLLCVFRVDVSKTAEAAFSRAIEVNILRVDDIDWYIEVTRLHQ